MVELLEDVRSGSESEHDLGDGRGRRVLAGHEECDHHVGKLLIWDGSSVLAPRAHQLPYDIQASLVLSILSALDDVYVSLRNGFLSAVAGAVVR